MNAGSFFGIGKKEEKAKAMGSAGDGLLAPKKPPQSPLSPVKLRQRLKTSIGNSFRPKKVIKKE